MEKTFIGSSNKSSTVANFVIVKKIFRKANKQQGKKCLNNRKVKKVIQMNKKIGIIIFIIIIILAIIIGTIMFTGLGREIRTLLHYQFTIPKEIVTVEEQEHITVTYTYKMEGESFDIDVTDKELIQMITDSISNKKLENYSGQIGLAVMGEYTVNLGNNISFQFDCYDDDGFVMLYNQDKHFLTKINPEILRKIIEIVDVKLTENIEMFKTDKITVTKQIMNENKASVLSKENLAIEQKTAIEYILRQCKNIYTKEINYEPNIVTPDYVMEFHDNVQLFIYDKNERGWLLKDGILSEAYGLNVFDTILENAFENIEEKKQMFTADKITITNPKKSVEITEKNIMERITTPLIYSAIQETNWLSDYNITEEYNNGIKIKINDYEFLIPGKIGTVTIGNRYIISADKKIRLCFPLQDLEEYANELLR